MVIITYILLVGSCKYNVYALYRCVDNQDLVTNFILKYWSSLYRIPNTPVKAFLTFKDLLSIWKEALDLHLLWNGFNVCLNAETCHQACQKYVRKEFHGSFRVHHLL